MSRELADRILELSPAMLNYEMTGILSRMERMALCDRLKGIQEAILKQRAYEEKHQGEPSKFVEPDKWAEATDALCEKAVSDERTRRHLDTHTYVDTKILLGTKIF